MEELVVIAVCLFFNALLAAYEMAFVSVPKPELRKSARTGNGDAKRILSLRESPERTLSIIQIGITLVGSISAAVGGAGASESIEPIFREQWGMAETTAEFLSIFLVVIPIAFLSVVIGELVPKTLAIRNPLRITLLGAKPLFIADRILAPIVSLLEWSTRSFLRWFFPRSKPLPTLPETSVEIESLPQHHQQAILNLAYIEHKRIRDIYLPWKDVVFVRRTDKMEDVVTVVFASGHTRLPVVDQENVIGILHTKEFIVLRETGIKDWSTAIRPVIRIHAHDPVLPTLRKMQLNRSHMAAVFSTVGEKLGIVTLEDITEEIWGDIYDEDDHSAIRKIFSDRVKLRMRKGE